MSDSSIRIIRLIKNEKIMYLNILIIMFYNLIILECIINSNYSIFWNYTGKNNIIAKENIYEVIKYFY